MEKLVCKIIKLMRLLLNLALCLLLTSCVTRFRSDEKLPLTMSHEVLKDRITVVAEVTNESNRPALFDRNTDAYGIDLSAVDREQMKWTKVGSLFTPPIPSRDRMERIGPGGSITFRRRFRYEKNHDGVLLFKNAGSLPGSECLIWDDELKVSFYYHSKRGDWRPKHVWLKRGSFVAVSLGDSIEFPAP